MLRGVYFWQLRFAAEQALSGCLALRSTLGLSDFSLMLSTEGILPLFWIITQYQCLKLQSGCRRALCVLLSLTRNGDGIKYLRGWRGEFGCVYAIPGFRLLLKYGTDHVCSLASGQLDPFCPVRKDSYTHLFPVPCKYPREASLPFSICDQSCVSREGHEIGQYNRWQ